MKVCITTGNVEALSRLAQEYHAFYVFALLSTRGSTLFAELQDGGVPRVSANNSSFDFTIFTIKQRHKDALFHESAFQ